MGKCTESESKCLDLNGMFISHTQRELRKHFRRGGRKNVRAGGHDVAITFTNHGSCSYFHKSSIRSSEPKFRFR